MNWDKEKLTGMCQICMEPKGFGDHSACAAEKKRIFGESCERRSRKLRPMDEKFINYIAGLDR